MMFRIEAGESAKRSDLKSVREETGPSGVHVDPDDLLEDGAASDVEWGH